MNGKIEITHEYNEGATIGPVLGYHMIEMKDGSHGIAMRVAPGDPNPNIEKNTQWLLFHTVYPIAAELQANSDGNSYVLLSEESFLYLDRKTPGYGEIVALATASKQSAPEGRDS